MGLKYYADKKDAYVSDLLSQANIKTENYFMSFSGFTWQEFTDTRRSIGSYIIFYQGGTIDHDTHVIGPVDQSGAESEYNPEFTAVIALAHFRDELFNKDPDIVPDKLPLIILDSKSDVCMAKNGKDANQTRHIARRAQFLRYGEKWKIHRIDKHEGGLQLADISTKNVGENDLNPRNIYHVKAWKLI